MFRKNLIQWKEKKNKTMFIKSEEKQFAVCKKKKKMRIKRQARLEEKMLTEEYVGGKK